MQFTVERKAGIALSCIAVAEGYWIFVNAVPDPNRLLRYAGFVSGSSGWLGWALAAITAVLFIAYAARLPSVKANLLRPSELKVLAILLAGVSGLCEECIFRKWLMDSMLRHEFGTVFQVLTSAASFGLVHAVWGLFKGSVRAALGATLVTGVLGFALAIVYVLSGRNVAPCVVAHLLINVFAEPGLVLAALRGEMSRSTDVAGG